MRRIPTENETSSRPASQSLGRHATHAENLQRRSLTLKERLFGPNHHQLGVTLFAKGRIDHEVM